MNFLDMHELDPSSIHPTVDPDGTIHAPLSPLPLAGYRLFWVVLCTVMTSLAACMWRQGLFKAV